MTNVFHFPQTPIAKEFILDALFIVRNLKQMPIGDISKVDTSQMWLEGNPAIYDILAALSVEFGELALDTRAHAKKVGHGR